MLLFLADLREQFGSVEGYAKHVGVAGATVERMRDQLLA
jgi:protein-tyrosine phosphatase